jgi:hypothetical protein
MIKAYLQNKKAQYYYLSGDGGIALSDCRKELQAIPETMESGETQTSFVFRHDGCRILSYLFLNRKIEPDCILTLEADDVICGDLDFSTTLLFGSRELRINCMHF